MIGVIGDTHFGAGYNMGKTDPATQLNNRLIDFSNTFNSIIDGFIARKVTTVVLTGDIFETRHPTASQHKIFSKCVQRAIDLGMKVLINVGNHDQQRHIDTTTVDIYNALKVPGVEVYQDIGVHSVDDNTHIILMPYRDKRMLGGDSNAEAIATLKQELDNITDMLDGNIVVVGHYMLEKGLEGIDPDMFSMNELMLPLDMFDNCDVTIMGHIHKPDVISSGEKPTIVYSGSMEKVSFGEKDHTKISLVIDPADIYNIEVIPTSTIRNLFELEFDYSDQKPFKQNINNQITSDIDGFADANEVKHSICKVIVKIKESDLYYIDQSIIKNHLLNKGVHFCTGVHVSSINNRQLRNQSINETLSSRKAMAAFIEGLHESNQMKKKLLKHAEQIIDEVEGT